MSFEWQTEEDVDWDDQAWREKPETAVPRKPPWRTLAVVAVLFVIAGILIYQQVNKRLDEATSNVESDIFAAHNLLSRVAASQDVDLSKTVLSGRDLGWSGIQTELISGGNFYVHPGLQLTLPEDSAAYAPLSREDERFIDLILSPDLNSAELHYARDYLALTDDGLEEVTLQQTAVYRRGKTRWLYAPPLEEFWGDWQTAEQENLTVVYPQRDEEVVQELTNDLQKLLDEVCRQLPELNCSAETQIQIRFDVDAESLLESADPANLYQASLRLSLPTPTLIGLPVNNDGYEALRYAYGANMVAALIADHVAYDCCRHAPIFQTILTYQLSELGLATWLVTQETQRLLVNEGLHAEMLFTHWSSNNFSVADGVDGRRLYGFVDFLVKQVAANQTPIQILEKISQTQGYQAWLNELSNYGSETTFGLVDAVSQDWWFYTVTQAEATAAAERPISFPAQDLQVGCARENVASEFVSPQTQLLRYELGNDNWVEEATYQGFAFFNPLPSDEGVILQRIEASEEQFLANDVVAQWAGDRNGAGRKCKHHFARADKSRRPFAVGLFGGN